MQNLYQNHVYVYSFIAKLSLTQFYYVDRIALQTDTVYNIDPAKTNPACRMFVMTPKAQTLLRSKTWTRIATSIRTPVSLEALSIPPDLILLQLHSYFTLYIHICMYTSLLLK